MILKFDGGHLQVQVFPDPPVKAGLTKTVMLLICQLNKAFDDNQVTAQSPIYLNITTSGIISLHL